MLASAVVVGEADKVTERRRDADDRATVKLGIELTKVNSADEQAVENRGFSTARDRDRDVRKKSPG